MKPSVNSLYFTFPLPFYQKVCTLPILNLLSSQASRKILSENSKLSLKMTVNKKTTTQKLGGIYQKNKTRRVTRNFLGQGSFLGIRHFKKHSPSTRERKVPRGKKSRFFRLETLKNVILTENFDP